MTMWHWYCLEHRTNGRVCISVERRHRRFQQADCYRTEFEDVLSSAQAGQSGKSRAQPKNEAHMNPIVENGVAIPGCSPLLLPIQKRMSDNIVKLGLYFYQKS